MSNIDLIDSIEADRINSVEELEELTCACESSQYINELRADRAETLNINIDTYSRCKTVMLELENNK